MRLVPSRSGDHSKRLGAVALSWKIVAMVAMCLIAACSGADSAFQASESTTSTASSASTVAPTTTTSVATTTTTSTTTTTTTLLTPGPTGEELLELAGPITHSPIVSFRGEYVGIDEAFYPDTGFLLARSVDGLNWTTEPVVDWPESTSWIVDTAATDDGLAVLVSTSFGRAALLTTTDLVNWRREAIPDVPGAPEKLAGSSSQLVVMLRDTSDAAGQVSLTSGPIGGPFRNDSASTLSSGDDITLGDDGLLTTSIRDSFGRRDVAFAPWPDPSAAVVASPDDRFFNALAVEIGEDGALYAATANALWETRDPGATWTQSVIPTELAPAEDASVFVDGPDVVVELSGTFTASSDDRRILLRTVEAWHRQSDGPWTLVDTWTTIGDPFSHPPGETTVDALPSVQGFADDLLSVRWTVQTTTVGTSDLASGSTQGAFIEEIPIG